MRLFSSSICSNRGMAVISLDFSSVFICLRVKVLAEAQVQTKWLARLAVVGWDGVGQFQEGPEPVFNALAEEFT